MFWCGAFCQPLHPCLAVNMTRGRTMALQRAQHRGLTPTWIGENSKATNRPKRATGRTRLSFSLGFFLSSSTETRDSRGPSPNAVSSFDVLFMSRICIEWIRTAHLRGGGCREPHVKCGRWSGSPSHCDTQTQTTLGLDLSPPHRAMALTTCDLRIGEASKAQATCSKPIRVVHGCLHWVCCIRCVDLPVDVP